MVDDIRAEQVPHARDVTVGPPIAVDNLPIKVFDGHGWSRADNVAQAPFTMTVRPTALPVVTTANMSVPTSQTLVPLPY